MLGTVWTIGYQGRTIDEFIDLLKKNGVKRLVDIRDNPISRKRGFSRRALEKELASNGIEYLGCRILGAPRALRHAKDMTSEGFLNAYRKHFSENKQAFSMLMRSAVQRPTALLCFERDPSTCHRSVVALAMAEEGFTVEHIV